MSRIINLSDPPLPNGVLIGGVAHFVTATQPTTRVDGSALVTGDRWNNTANLASYIYDGVAEEWRESPLNIHRPQLYPPSLGVSVLTGSITTSVLGSGGARRWVWVSGATGTAVYTNQDVSAYSNPLIRIAKLSNRIAYTFQAKFLALGTIRVQFSRNSDSGVYSAEFPNVFGFGLRIDNDWTYKLQARPSVGGALVESSVLGSFDASTDSTGDSITLLWNGSTDLLLYVNQIFKGKITCAGMPLDERIAFSYHFTAAGQANVVGQAFDLHNHYISIS